MNTPDSKSDLELINAIRRDDHVAFESLYDRYWKALYIKACKSVDDVEAKDMVQEVMLSLWNRRHAASFKKDQDVASYLYVALKYRVISYYAFSRTEIKKAEHFMIPTVWNPEHMLESKEFKMQLDAVVEKMPGRMQLIFRMSRDDQISISEIAFQLNLSEQTVKNQLTSALKRLRATLHPAYQHVGIPMIYILGALYK